VVSAWAAVVVSWMSVIALVQRLGPVRVLCDSDPVRVESIPTIRGALVAHCPSLALFVELVEGLPQVMAAAKDAEGRYIYVNRGFADRLGRSASALLGASVAELFAPELAASYAAQDDDVMRTGRSLSGHLELIVRVDGQLGWYLTSKSRLVDNDGAPVGVAVLSVDLHAHMNSAHGGLAQALTEVRSRLDESWRVSEIADIAGLSTKQLERLTHRTLGLPPRAILQRLRIEHAVRLMSTTEMTMGEIAQACGFYDQSSFTRQFRGILGLPPGAYRRQALA
jgi:PAS domain S-box-containing protein